MNEAFMYFKGIPKEIIFDNMKTVVDRENNRVGNIKLNSKFSQYSKESMIKYKGKKYSVPTYLIGKSVTVTETEEYIHIYYTTNLVRKHKKDKKFLNYNKDDMIEILKSDPLKGLEDEEIETFIENNLDDYDNL